MPPEGRDGHGSTMPDSAYNIFSVPAPIKRIFDKFPLVTLPSNDLPRRSNTTQNGNKLFVFTDRTGAKHGRPSFNPQCLKWQVGLLDTVDGFLPDNSITGSTGLSKICRD